MTHYKPTDATTSPRFAGVRTFMRLPHVRELADVDFVAIGIPFDDQVTYRPGARFGPEGMRRVSGMLKAWNPAQQVDIFSHLSGVDYGDVDIVPGYIEETLDQISAEYEKIARAGVVPYGMGGDHSVVLGELRGLAAVHGKLAVVHLDAHVDTSDGYFGKKYDHGTPFRRAAEEGLVDTAHSIQVGIRGSKWNPRGNAASIELGYEVLTMEEVEEIGLPETLRRIHARVGKTQCFVSFDIDAIDPAYAPGTGTPEVGGFTSREALKLIRGLKGLRIRGADLVEVIPALDTAEITALLGATILHELITLQALARAERNGG